jgi:hypothetical protein
MLYCSKHSAKVADILYNVRQRISSVGDNSSNNIKWNISKLDKFTFVRIIETTKPIGYTCDVFLAWGSAKPEFSKLTLIKMMISISKI